MKAKFKKRYIFLILLLLVVLYLFWGPLFPWSPIKPGFDRIESSKATTYITRNEGDSVVYAMDEIIKEAEAFHDLRFKKRFKVIILGSKSSMKRFLPWLRGSGYSVKIGYANLIYIGANARTSPYGVRVFLKHEISHLLLHQNMASGRDNLRIVDQGWLTDGVATYFGGPQYYEKNEFVASWEANNLAFDSLHEQNPLTMDRSMRALKYTYYRFFVQFLIDTHGLGKFQAYLKEYLRTPLDYKMLFPKVFGDDLNGILKKFDSYMHQEGQSARLPACP